MPDRMPEDLPDRMPEDMPEHMPEDMPDRMPEDMSDRTPEDLPVRKCINVMVGIIRSEVIFFQALQASRENDDSKIQQAHAHFSRCNLQTPTLQVTIDSTIAHLRCNIEAAGISQRTFPGWWFQPL